MALYAIKFLNNACTPKNILWKTTPTSVIDSIKSATIGVAELITFLYFTGSSCRILIL